ncbi:MAG: SGNH/GDSL hydrolase family protein [Victivallales bacterium]|jgi:lysophospholipase L1-like esterase
MRRISMVKVCALVLGISLLSLCNTYAQDVKPAAANSALPKDSRLAIIGDSITEQKQYTKFMETYLLACAGRKDMTVFQFGWGGERAGGFLSRLENDLSAFKPTAATTCYGMNDGSYVPYNDTIGGNYEKAMRAVLEKLKEAGVTQIVAGSPGAVDTKYFVKSPAVFGDKPAGEGYNENLRRLRDIDEKLAGELKTSFADVHTPLVDAMAKAKKEKGPDYDVCGRDGVHPGVNGHLIMAYAFLKALGCDGNIAEITVDMKNGAVASEGHKVLSSSAGKVELESVKYPFCFDADPNQSNSTRSILPYVSFNQDLNRFILKVKNLGSEKAKVSWGAETKEFTKTQLESGINLAAEFSKTPFDENFSKIIQAVAAKQNFETLMIKGIVTQFRSLSEYTKNDAELKGLFDTLKEKLIKIESKKDADVKALIVPVKYSITVMPLP